MITYNQIPLMRLSAKHALNDKVIDEEKYQEILLFLEHMESRRLLNEQKTQENTKVMLNKVRTFA